MNKIVVFYFCLATIQLIVHDASGFFYLDELYGKPCRLDDGTAGVYKRAYECTPINVRAEARIACCPLIDLNRSGDTNITTETKARTAFAACEKYELDELVFQFEHPGDVATGKSKFPYMAALGYDNIQGGLTDNPIVYKCTGVLISFRYVLTAAHCVRNANNEVPVTVRLGAPDLKSTGNFVQDILVSRVIVHPNYTSTVNYNDLALLRLQKLAKRSINVSPICVQKEPLTNMTIDEDTFLATVGIGRSNVSDNSNDLSLKTMNTSIVLSDICGMSYTRKPKFPSGLDENMFCAIDSNFDSCSAEISGPLLVISGETKTVIGIPTFGETCHGFTPDVYISIYPYLDWIEEYSWPKPKETPLSTDNSTSLVQTSSKEGTECRTKSGDAGIYKKLQECPPLLADAVGKTAKAEIVCCPQSALKKTGIRANAVCREYGTEEDTSTADAGPNQGTDNQGSPFHILSRVGEFPHMAALGYESNFDDTDASLVYNCGGALISTRYVLTLAHCVSNIQNQVPIKVRLGSLDFNSTGGNVQEIAVGKIILHPQYKRGSNYHNIALIQLAKPAKLSSSVKPVCLQTKPLNINNDTSLVMIGFRGPSNIDRSANKLMKTTNISLVPTNVCNESYRGFRKIASGIDNNMICALDSNWKRREDFCFNEIFGPLLMISRTAQTLVGLPSFGKGCGSEPDVYTYVYSYLNWIESHVWPVEDQA